MKDKTDHLLPLSFTLRLDPVDAELMRRIVRSRGSRSLQNTVLEVLREWDQALNNSQERRVDDVEYRGLYFDLLEQTATLRKQLKKLVKLIDYAGNGLADANEKKRKKK